MQTGVDKSMRFTSTPQRISINLSCKPALPRSARQWTGTLLIHISSPTLAHACLTVAHMAAGVPRRTKPIQTMPSPVLTTSCDIRAMFQQRPTPSSRYHANPHGDEKGYNAGPQREHGIPVVPCQYEITHHTHEITAETSFIATQSLCSWGESPRRIPPDS